MSENAAPKGRTWFERDYPVLLAAVDLCQASPFNQTTTWEVAERLGIEQPVVAQAVSNLREKYLHAQDESDQVQRDYIIKGATEAGLVAADVWPSGDLLAERFLAAIERAVETTPQNSPRAAALGTLLDAVKDIGTGVAAGVLSQLLSQVFGIPSTR